MPPDSAAAGRSANGARPVRASSASARVANTSSGSRCRRAGEAQVLHHRQIAVQAEGLRHVADLRLQRRTSPRRSIAEHVRLVRLDLEQPGERAQQRRLAGAVGPDDADDLRRPRARDRCRASADALAEALAQLRRTIAERQHDRSTRSRADRVQLRSALGVASIVSDRGRRCLRCPGWKRSTPSRMRTLARYTWPMRSLRVSIFSGVKFAWSATKLISPGTRWPGVLSSSISTRWPTCTCAHVGDRHVDLHVLVRGIEHREQRRAGLRQLARPDELRLHDRRHRPARGSRTWRASPRARRAARSASSRCWRSTSSCGARRRSLPLLGLGARQHVAGAVARAGRLVARRRAPRRAAARCWRRC